jgi:hypothetical protein
MFDRVMGIVKEFMMVVSMVVVGMIWVLTFAFILMLLGVVFDVDDACVSSNPYGARVASARVKKAHRYHGISSSMCDPFTGRCTFVRDGQEIELFGYERRR